MLAVLCTRMILAQRAILSISVYPQFVGSFVHSFSSVVIAPTLYIPLRRACSFSRRAPRFEWAEPTKRRWFSAIQRFLLLLFGAAVIAAGVAEAAAAAVFVVDHLESLSGFFWYSPQRLRIRVRREYFFKWRKKRKEKSATALALWLVDGNGPHDFLVRICIPSRLISDW